MDHALIVRGLQPLADLPEDVDDPRHGQASLAPHDTGEVMSVNVLHRQELHASGFAEVVDAQDVLVCDVARELNLALEALENCRITGEIETNDFERDVAVELAIADEVDLAHSTFT